VAGDCRRQRLVKIVLGWWLEMGTHMT
jgi:hypothetical protein